MPDYKPRHSASTAIAITPGALGSSSARQSAAIDNSTSLFVEALASVTFKLVAGTPLSEKCVILYAYASEDGTRYTDNATGLDAALVLRSPTNLVEVRRVATPDPGGLVYHSGPVAIAGAFGGMFLPRKWGLAIQNLTGLAFDPAVFAASYTGLYLGS